MKTLPRPDAKLERIVLAHGVFDLLHLGHIRHLQEARSLGDRLVVSITPDSHVCKGPGRPHFSEGERLEAIKALSCVDDAFINDGPDAVSAIGRIQPSIFVKGADYKEAGNDIALARELGALKCVGGRFVTTHAKKWSSSRLINTEMFPPETMAYLEMARKRDFLPRILEAFVQADRLKIAFVGERINDEYQYCRALGIPSKEPILAVCDVGFPQTYQGGIVACSLHAEWPGASVVTIDSSITKKRWVEIESGRKLFEAYSHSSLTPRNDVLKEFRNRLSSMGADVVIVCDFGHGLMGQSERSILLSSSRFLAVNAQTNAANRGYNHITKYCRADYVCVDEPEARLAVQMPEQKDVHTLACQLTLTKKMSFVNLLITRGCRGAHAFGEGTSKSVPPFATKIIDTIGAGDAVISVTAPLIAAGLGIEEAAFVGNVAGAIAVGTVGTGQHVKRSDLVGMIESLLK